MGEDVEKIRYVFDFTLEAGADLDILCQRLKMERQEVIRLALRKLWEETEGK